MKQPETARSVRSALTAAMRLDVRRLALLAGGLATLALLVALAQVCQASVQRGERVRAELRQAPDPSVVFRSVWNLSAH